MSSGRYFSVRTHVNINLYLISKNNGLGGKTDDSQVCIIEKHELQKVYSVKSTQVTSVFPVAYVVYFSPFYFTSTYIFIHSFSFCSSFKLANTEIRYQKVYELTVRI